MGTATAVILVYYYRRVVFDIYDDFIVRQDSEGLITKVPITVKETGEPIRFLETSAKANINIDNSFYDLAEATLDKAPSPEDRGGIIVGQPCNIGVDVAI
uniref:Uncharacterized protein n=1 Tax=Acrobeloides nanus TaxID=290746 RepID=A0A914D2K1_9BILA